MHIHFGLENLSLRSSIHLQTKKDSDAKKVHEFLRNLREKPEWARSLTDVRLNAVSSKGEPYLQAFVNDGACFWTFTFRHIPFRRFVCTFRLILSRTPVGNYSSRIFAC